MHLARRADDRGDAVAAGRADEHQQRARDQRGRHHRQRDGEERLERGGAGDAAGLLERRVHLLHRAGDRDEGVGVVERGQHPDEAAQRVDVDRAGRVRRHAEEGAQEHVHIAHVRVEQAQPGHRADVRRHHVGEHEQAAEELAAVEVGAAHQPGQRERDERAQHHRRGGGDERVLERAPVHRVGVQARERLQREGAVREERLDDQVDQREHLEQEHEVDDQQDDDPLHVKVPAVVRAQQEEQQRHVDDQQDAQHADGAAVGDDELQGEAHAARDGLLVGLDARDVLAHGLLEAVGQVRGHGFADGAAADEEQLQQDALALGALLALRGGCGGIGQPDALIGEGEQQRAAEGGALTVVHGGELLFDLGGHLGTVHGERDVEELHGGAVLLLFRQGGDKRVEIGSGGLLVAHQFRPAGEEHGVQLVFGLRALLAAQAIKRGRDGRVIVGIQCALHVIQVRKAVLRVKAGGGERVHAHHASCDHQHAHEQRNRQRGLDDRGLPVVAELRLWPRFVLHPASTPLQNGIRKAPCALSARRPSFSVVGPSGGKAKPPRGGFVSVVYFFSGMVTLSWNWVRISSRWV